MKKFVAWRHPVRVPPIFAQGNSSATKRQPPLVNFVQAPLFELTLQGAQRQNVIATELVLAYSGVRQKWVQTSLVFSVRWLAFFTHKI
jgi:hypothetical protein